MKKILLSTVATTMLATSLMAGGSSAGETTARLDSLGLGNTQVTDFSNIWANPANINSLSDQFFMQSVNQATAGFGGAVYDAGFGKLGLFVERANSFYTIDSTTVAGTYYTSAAFTLAPAAAPAVPTLIDQMDLIYGMALSKSMDLGVRVSYASNDAGTFEFTDTVTPTNSGTATAKASQLEIEAGVNLKDLGLDVAVSYGLPYEERSVDSTHATTNEYKSDAMVLTATIGHTADMKKGKKLRSVVYVSSSQLGSEATDGTTTETKTNNTTSLNVSTTYSKQSNGTTTYVGIGARYSNNVEEFNDGNGATAIVTTMTTGAISIPAVAAIETKTSENWTVRGGVNLDLWSMDTVKEEQINSGVDQGTYVIEQASNDVANINFGAGYKDGNFEIDTVIAAGFTGGNLLANASAKLSATYKF